MNKVVKINKLLNVEKLVNNLMGTMTAIEKMVFIEEVHHVLEGREGEIEALQVTIEGEEYVEALKEERKNYIV